VTLPAWVRDWRIVAATVGGLGLLSWLARRRSSPSSSPALDVPWPDAPPGELVRWDWREIQGSPIRLVQWMRYRGCVRVSAWNVLRGLATIDRVREGVEAAGFADVFVSGGDPPAGWDPSVECFRYVEATWAAADRDYDRPDKLAVAWRLGTA
jgi:hypothetical protein